jgi:hypothetical protein
LNKKERADIQSTIEEKKAQLAEKNATIKATEQQKKAQQKEKEAIEAEINNLKKKLDSETKDFENDLRKKYRALLEKVYKRSGKKVTPACFKMIVVKDKHGDYSELFNLHKCDGFPVESRRGLYSETSVIKLCGEDGYLVSLVEDAFKKAGVIILEETPDNRMPIRDRFFLTFVYFRGILQTDSAAVGAAVSFLEKTPKDKGIFKALFEADQEREETKQTAKEEGD